MKKYFKYFHQDSARYIRQVNRAHKKKMDSVARAHGKKHYRMLQETGRLPGYSPGLLDSIKDQIQLFSRLAQDTLSSDSVRNLAKSRIQDLYIQRLRMDPNFLALQTAYGNVPDSVSWQTVRDYIPYTDSLKVAFLSSQELIAYSESFVQKQLLNHSEMGGFYEATGQAQAISSATRSYRKRFDVTRNKDSLMQATKEEAARRALDYLSQNTSKLEESAQRASRLLSKYRAFSNSLDLSDATKRTSMHGRTFFERLVVGGNFNVVSTKPLSLDLAPQLGYRLSSRFFVGAGLRYRTTISDSIRHAWYVSPRNTSGKVFVNYDVYKSWFCYLEGEWTPLESQLPEEQGEYHWYANYFAGAGRRFLIHPKLYMTVSALYRINNQVANPIHPQRLQIRVGFQLSELALRKRRINYDPNR